MASDPPPEPRRFGPRNVRLAGLKEVARRELPAGHVVRETILALPDTVPRSTFVAQAEVLAKILLAAEAETAHALQVRAGVERAAVELDAARRAAIGIEREVEA